MGVLLPTEAKLVTAIAAINDSERANVSELPFTVRICRTEDQLQQAVELRASAYHRHHADFPGLDLNKPDWVDLHQSTVVLLAQSKSDGLPVGTVRLHTNDQFPLPVESDVELPPQYLNALIGYVSRLAVTNGSKGRLVKVAMFKALHRLGLAKQLNFLLIGTKDNLAPDYLSLGFADVFPDAKSIPLATAGGLPHRLLALPVFSAERHWFGLNHPLYRFMSERYHPDIEIFNSVSSGWTRPRKDRRKVSREIDPQLSLPIV